MPTTASGETVYADPDDVLRYVQTDPNNLGQSETDLVAFVQDLQVKAKARIDEYVDRSDFEDHAGDTVTLNGGPDGQRILELPSPVRSVTEVRVDGDVVPSDEYVVDGDQLIRTEPPTVDAVDVLARDGTSPPRPHWETGYQNIAVDLDWGYQSPPADVAEAEMKLVNNTLQGLGQMREGLVIQQDDVDVSVSLPEAMTPEIKQMLRAHREGGRTMGVL